MRRIKRAKPSPALLVAVVALVAALAGTAIGGVAVTALNKQEKKQVKKISKTQAKKQARKLDKLIELLPGPQGDQGPAGAQGDQGPIGPTEGTSSNGAFLPPADPEETVESDDFDTATPGRLLVIKPVAGLSITCDTDKAWSVWLEVDGDPLPGSGISSIASGEFLYGLTLSGVTTDPLPAGTHTAAVGVSCDSTISGGELNTNGGVSAVVLGG